MSNLSNISIDQLYKEIGDISLTIKSFEEISGALLDNICEGSNREIYCSVMKSVYPYKRKLEWAKRVKSDADMIMSGPIFNCLVNTKTFDFE